MKFRISKWLGCSLAALALMGAVALVPKASARRVTNYRPVRTSYQSNNQDDASLEQVTSIPDQGYTNYVTGTNALYTLPGTVRGSRRIMTRSQVQQLADRRIRFMTYREAITNRGSIYYKIVSQHHSVRGWMYYTAIRSILTPEQQATDLKLASQINQSEVLADQTKHASLTTHASVNLKSARRELRHAHKSMVKLKGTPDYSGAKAAYSQGKRYLQKIESATPNLEAVQGIKAIKKAYDQAAKSVNVAKVASMKHDQPTVDKNVKDANRSLRKVRKVLNKIHNQHDRKVAMDLFNQALSYVNDDYSFVPASDLSAKLPAYKALMLIREYENDAQRSIMDLYPNLDDFDVALMDAYQAQNDLNRAQSIVANLQGSHLKKTELNDIQDHQHQINQLWNI